MCVIVLVLVLAVALGLSYIMLPLGDPETGTGAMIPQKRRSR